MAEFKFHLAHCLTQFCAMDGLIFITTITLNTSWHGNYDRLGCVAVITGRLQKWHDMTVMMLF